MKVSDFKFHLIDDLNLDSVSKEDIAKRKLLYGEVLFKVSDVVCNYVELISGKYHIVVPAFYSMVSDDECVRYDLDRVLNSSLSFLHGFLYQVDGVAGLFCIIKDGCIVCMFSSSTMFGDLICSETQNYYKIMLKKFYLAISKKDLSYTTSYITI